MSLAFSSRLTMGSYIFSIVPSTMNSMIIRNATGSINFLRSLKMSSKVLGNVCRNEL